MDKAINKWLILTFAIPMPAVHIVLGLANIQRVASAEPYLAAMAICLALVAVLCWPGTEYTLALPLAWGVVSGVVAMDVLVTSVLPSGVHPGYAAWHCGAIQMLLVSLALRNRMKMAWLGIGVFAVIDMSMSLHHRLSVIDGLALVLTPVMWVVIASAVNIMLWRSGSLIETYMTQSRQSAQLLARQHAMGLSREQWMLELEHSTRPALELIALRDLTEDNRVEMVLLEAELRDQIRGRALASGGVLRAARRARLRGVKVDILDDRKGALPSQVFRDATTQLVATLEHATTGIVRCRALPEGEHPAVTILAFDESEQESELYLEVPDVTPPG